MPTGDVRGPDQSAAVSRQRILPRRTNFLKSRSGASLCVTESPSESEAFFGRFSNELDRSHRPAAKNSTCSDVEQVEMPLAYAGRAQWAFLAMRPRNRQKLCRWQCALSDKNPFPDGTGLIPPGDASPRQQQG